MRFVPLLILLAACDRREEAVTTTLPPTPAPRPPVERTIERSFDPRTYCTAETARKAGFGDGVTVRLAESSSRNASYEVVDAAVRGIVSAYLHDDDAQARERFAVTAAGRGAGAGATRYETADGEAGCVSGRISVIARFSGDGAAKLARALVEQLATGP